MNDIPVTSVMISAVSTVRDAVLTKAVSIESAVIRSATCLARRRLFRAGLVCGAPEFDQRLLQHRDAGRLRGRPLRDWVVPVLV